MHFQQNNMCTDESTYSSLDISPRPACKVLHLVLSSMLKGHWSRKQNEAKLEGCSGALSYIGIPGLENRKLSRDVIAVTSESALCLDDHLPGKGEGDFCDPLSSVRDFVAITLVLPSVPKQLHSDPCVHVILFCCSENLKSNQSWMTFEGPSPPLPRCWGFGHLPSLALLFRELFLLGWEWEVCSLETVFCSVALAALILIVLLRLPLSSQQSSCLSFPESAGVIDKHHHTPLAVFFLMVLLW